MGSNGLPDWFATNYLPVTTAIARRWARLTIEAKRKGLSIAKADGLIAATALEHDLVLVTRDIGDFAGVTIPILNPWDT